MTKEQLRISQTNRNHTWKALCGSHKGIPGMVLHHVDTTMLYRDPERYILWKPDDLKLMSKADHIRLHRTGSRHSLEAKQKMSQSHRGMKFTPEHRRALSQARVAYFKRLKMEEQVEQAEKKMMELRTK